MSPTDTRSIDLDDRDRNLDTILLRSCTWRDCKIRHRRRGGASALRSWIDLLRTADGFMCVGNLREVASPLHEPCCAHKPVAHASDDVTKQCVRVRSRYVCACVACTHMDGHERSRLVRDACSPWLYTRCYPKMLMVGYEPGQLVEGKDWLWPPKAAPRGPMIESLSLKSIQFSNACV